MEIEPPKIPHPIHDRRSNVTFCVLAYRALSEQEVVRCVRQYMAGHPQTVRANRGKQLTIATSIGALD